MVRPAMMRQTAKSELSNSISRSAFSHIVDPDGLHEKNDEVSNQICSRMGADGYVKITLRCVETAVPTSDLLCRVPRIHTFNCSGADSLVDGRFTRTPGQMCVSLGCPRQAMCKAVCAELTTGPSRSCLQRASLETQSCLWKTTSAQALDEKRTHLTHQQLPSLCHTTRTSSQCQPTKRCSSHGPWHPALA